MTADDIIKIVTEIFQVPGVWYLVLILILASDKKFRIAAIFLLSCHLVNGVMTWWSIAITGIIVIVLDSLRSSKNAKFIKDTIDPIHQTLDRFNTRLDKLERDRWEE